MPELDRTRAKVKELGPETAGNMVVKYHYAHSLPSITLAYGLFVDDVLAGVITYGVSSNRNNDLICGPGYHGQTLELNRLYVHDWAGRNSESYLIGESLKFLKRDHPQILIIVSYADSAHGHKGMVYQATNWIYTGESVMSTEGWMHEGKRYHPRSLSSMFGSCSAEVVQKNLPGAVPIKGEVKYRYVYLLGDKKTHRELVEKLKYPSLPYPKVVAESLYNEDGSKKEKVKEVKPKKSKTPPPPQKEGEVSVVVSSEPARSCCSQAAPADCPTCPGGFMIVCARHGIKHAKACPQFNTGEVVVLKTGGPDEISETAAPGT